ncbi:YIP1 family protein [Bacillus sp. FSL W7-1360]
MNTWLNIWVRPRQVMKQELENARTEERRWQLFFIVFISVALMVLIDYGGVFHDGAFQRAFVIGLIGALLAIFVAPWIYKWVGSWIGGKGSVLDLRVALIKGYYKPTLAIAALYLLLSVTLGENSFVNDVSSGSWVMISTPRNVLMAVMLLVISVVGSIWVVIIFLHALGEAHKFSAWKSLLMMVIIAVIGIIILVPILLLSDINQFNIRIY